MRARSLSFVVSVSLLHFAPLVAHADDLDDKAAVLLQRPDDAKAYEDYGTAAIGSRRYDDAIAKLKIGVARIPDFKRAYYLMAYAYRSKQAWVDAAAYYRICIAVKQQENEAYFGLGKALAGMGDDPAAVVAFKAYIEREKDPAKARFVDGARAEVAKLSATLPAGAGQGQGQGQGTTMAPAGVSDAAALKLEADSLKNQGRFEEATIAYKKAIAVDPNNQDLYNDLGNAYFGLKRYNDAAQAFRDATSRDPNYAIGWYNLANALRKADRKGEAVDAYKRYMALQPNDPDPYFGMGQTLKGMGDTQGAIKAFHRYLEMETRPEQSKWQEKARQELQALEGSQRTQLPAPGGKVGFDEK